MKEDKVFEMVRSDDGPLLVDSDRYVPLPFMNKSLVKWKHYLENFVYLHFFTQNEFKIKAGIPVDEDAVPIVGALGTKNGSYPGRMYPPS